MPDPETEAPQPEPEPEPLPEPEPEPEPVPEPVPEPEPVSAQPSKFWSGVDISFGATGDILVHPNIYIDANFRKTADKTCKYHHDRPVSSLLYLRQTCRTDSICLRGLVPVTGSKAS